MKCYVVADTNIIVSAFIFVMRKSKVEDSVPLKVLFLLLDRKNKIIPVFNDDILNEYKEVMSRSEFRISKPIIGKFLNDIRSIGVSLDAAKIDEELPDSDDVVFYQVVMEGRKTENSFLVTGNKRHFPAKEFIVSPAEFLERVAEFG